MRNSYFFVVLILFLSSFQCLTAKDFSHDESTRSRSSEHGQGDSSEGQERAIDGSSEADTVFNPLAPEDRETLTQQVSEFKHSTEASSGLSYAGNVGELQ